MPRWARGGGRWASHSPKTALPAEMGFFAHLRDSEGNEVGLHSLA